MPLIKEGFPEEEELVLCTVTNIHFHSVFVKMDEYDKTGLIHISEIAPGRIRNIRDFVIEGKKVVCKVLQVDKKKGHIDLSLRRVNENQKRRKIEEIKQEQKAEKIIEFVAKNNNLEFKKFYDELTQKITQKYPDLKSCFKDVVKNESLLAELGVDKKTASQLVDVIKVRFKEEDVIIGGVLKLESVLLDGVEIIKKALIETEETNQNVSISYAGGGIYNIKVKSNSYKEAEKILDNAVNKALSITEHGLGKGEFIRKEKE